MKNPQSELSAEMFLSRGLDTGVSLFYWRATNSFNGSAVVWLQPFRQIANPE